MNGIKLNEQATKELVISIARTELFEGIRSMKNAVPRIS